MRIASNSIDITFEFCNQSSKQIDYLRNFESVLQSNSIILSVIGQVVATNQKHDHDTTSNLKISLRKTEKQKNIMGNPEKRKQQFEKVWVSQS